MTAWLSLPSDSGQPAAASVAPGPIPSARNASVVGHRQAQARLAPSSSTSWRLRWVACTIVLRGPSAPAPSSTWAGVAP